MVIIILMHILILKHVYFVQFFIYISLCIVIIVCIITVEANLFYQSMININYIVYLQGLIYHYLGSQRLAEKTLRDAAKIDPNSHQTWYFT